jgi:hypothetical protein
MVNTVATNEVETDTVAVKKTAVKKKTTRKKAVKKPVDKVAAAEKSFFGSKEDHAEDRSVSSRRLIHDQVHNQVENFLSQGGRISQIDPHVTAEQDTKSGASYGSRPI